MKKRKWIFGLLFLAFIASAAAQQHDNGTIENEQPSRDADSDEIAEIAENAKNDGNSTAGTTQAAEKTNKGENTGKKKGNPALGKIQWKPMATKPDCGPGLNKDPPVFYHRHQLEKNKFYQCDRAGTAHERTCEKNHVYSGKKDICYYDKELNVLKFDCAPGLESNPVVRRHPYGKNWCKYILCDRTGKALERNCAMGTKWNNEARKCELTKDPCPSAAVLAFDCKPGLRRQPPRFYHAHSENWCKYIKCDRDGKATEGSCATGKKWSGQKENCVNMKDGESCHVDNSPAANCKRGMKSHPPVLFYPHPTKKNQFIQCDRQGKPHERTCETGTVYSGSFPTCRADSSEKVEYASSGCTLQPAYLLVMIALGICQWIRHM